MERRAYYFGVFFLLPALLIFTVFNYYPFILSIFYSFTEWNSITKPKFIGLDNYVAFFSDLKMIHGLQNTLKMVVYGIVVQNPVALVLAVLLSQNFFTRTYLRTAFYFPMIISLVISSVIWSQLLKYDGVLNTILSNLGFGHWVRDWLGTVQTSFPTIILISQWQAVGFCAIIYLAGIMSIPKEIYEAASIEGAKGLTMFRQITFPLLMPTVTVVMFLTVVGALKIFDLPFILTNGGPGQSSYTVFLAIYYSAFRSDDYGYASASGIIMSVIIVAISLIQLSITRKREVEL